MAQAASVDARLWLVLRGLRRGEYAHRSPDRASRHQAVQYPGRPRTARVKLLDFGIAKLLDAPIEAEALMQTRARHAFP